MKLIENWRQPGRSGAYPHNMKSKRLIYRDTSLRDYLRRSFHPLVSCVLLFAACSSLVSGQLSRKPSGADALAATLDKKPDSKKNSLLKITSREEFDSIARTFHPNTPYALPHAMFAIDRRAR